MLKNKKESVNRKKIQFVTGAILPFMLIAGVFFPYIGLVVMLMMAGFLILSLFKGRFWCGYICPRGSFLERYFSRFSLNRPIPAWLKSSPFKYTVLGFMLVFMTVNLMMAWDSLASIGSVFIRLCIQTSLIAVVLGYIFRPRTWCTFCPMGLLQGLLGHKKKLVKLTAQSCTDCKLCAKVCPVEVQVNAYKTEGAINSAVCLKCRNCVLNCPRQALSA
jgi:polyferredoxin